VHRAASLLLEHDRACSDIRARDQITDRDLHQVAAAQLAIDPEVK
jgi:hypothetical protein